MAKIGQKFAIEYCSYKGLTLLYSMIFSPFILLNIVLIKD